MNNFRKHLNTVNTHRREVRKMCNKCGIYWQGITHDLSKYNPVEFLSSVKYYDGTKSPIENEIDDIGYSICWLHHKSKNKHHWEYWTDPTHELNWEMPLKYVVEMFCDRVGACKAYQREKYTDRSPIEYFNKKTLKEEKNINPATFALLKSLLEMLAEKGETETCNYIRNMLRAGK